MSRTMVCVLGLSVALTGVTGCIEDDSVPNRRGIERPALIPTKQSDKDNAEHRALEPPKRELPSDSAKEFPGQTRLTSPRDSQTLFLDAGMGTVETSPATTSAPATAAAGDATTTAGVPESAPATNFATAPENNPQPDAKAAFGTSTPQLDETKPFARRGAVMAVPGTGEIIPADWGRAEPLAEYRHRPWSKSQTSFNSGEVKRNPLYYTNAFDHPQYLEGPAAVGFLENLAEYPWFYAETLAVPVLMVAQPPLIQKTTHNDGTDPNYHGYLPAIGEIVPAPLPGVIRWTYPFSDAEAVPDVQASSLPSPLATPGTTQPVTLPPTPGTTPSGNK